jgi:CubicO group peptidase (beta-lactamase class C family)
VYSNFGFGVLAETIESQSGIEFGRYLSEAVFEPLGMTASRLDGGAAAAGFGGISTVMTWCFSPQTCSRRGPCPAQCTPRRSACSSGADRGAARLRRCSARTTGVWVSRSGTTSRRTGRARNSPRTFGHFGQTGTFLWVDPARELSLVVLTARDFDEWAKPLWPALSDEVLREFGPD